MVSNRRHASGRWCPGDEA
uniref:Uncharacterized protein n=1 Tax=Arundo donax TaxID=35708 RepID=A0A0A9T9K9_ARUDO